MRRVGYASIRRIAVSHHDVLRRHPWARGLTSPGKVPPAQFRYMEALLRVLRRGGFSARMTHHAYHVLDSHSIGSALWEAGITAAIPKGKLVDLARPFLAKLPAAEFPYFHEHIQQHLTKSARGDKNTFEFGLDLILDGLEKLRDEIPVSRRRRRPH